MRSAEPQWPCRILRVSETGHAAREILQCAKTFFSGLSIKLLRTLHTTTWVPSRWLPDVFDKEGSSEFVRLFRKSILQRVLSSILRDHAQRSNKQMT